VSSPAIAILLTSAFVVIAALAGFVAYIHLKYTPIVVRVFEEKPMFLPFRAPRVDGGEDVRFVTRDGLRLAGTYFPARTARRTGVVVFCHEYLGDRWSVIPYAGHLRDLGFDLFCFDFRNHGESQGDPIYKPHQWVTEYEVLDLQAALGYLRSRPDADLAGVGLFGVSRGGGTALCVTAKDPRVWGVATDGAFPVRGTMLSYILRWAEIYVSNPVFWKAMPIWTFEIVSWLARVRTQSRLHCRYADLERAVARVAPRPWLAIHGQKDAYIGVDIARTLFDRAGQPKEFCVVAGAKHNQCRIKEPTIYPDRLSAFFTRYAPRSQASLAEPARATELRSDSFEAVPIQNGVGIPVAR